MITVVWIAFAVALLLLGYVLWLKKNEPSRQQRPRDEWDEIKLHEWRRHVRGGN